MDSHENSRKEVTTVAGVRFSSISKTYSHLMHSTTRPLSKFYSVFGTGASQLRQKKHRVEVSSVPNRRQKLRLSSHSATGCRKPNDTWKSLQFVTGLLQIHVIASVVVRHPRCPVSLAIWKVAMVDHSSVKVKPPRKLRFLSRGVEGCKKLSWLGRNLKVWKVFWQFRETARPCDPCDQTAGRKVTPGRSNASYTWRKLPYTSYASAKHIRTA